MTDDTPAGLYVHFPFCEKLCPYCDFAVFVRKEIPTAYTDRLIEAFAQRRDSYGEFRTVYIGGGTPSLWAMDDASRFVSSLDLADVEEFTVEANPVEITDGWLEGWRDLGATRISIGVQSFDDLYLKELGRNHDGEGARLAVERAVAGGFRVSLDLMYGGPNHARDVLERDLSMIESLSVSHISVYQLTVEPETRFAVRQSRGDLPLPPSDDVASFSRLVVASLGDMGLRRYEVSSFARRPEDESRHNRSYWRGVPYLGIGVGAHSLRHGERAIIRESVPRNLKQYLAGTSTLNEEVLQVKEHWFERCFLAARTTSPILPQEMAATFGYDVPNEAVVAFEETMQRVVREGWATTEEVGVRMTDLGLDFADTVAVWLDESLDRVTWPETV